ncbi:MAG: aminomethyl-transferring glycine dehydrogenase subunit GcvPA [Phycisphaerae bacterium]|nr:aminomethyl-transferring glycine dehydrogenase subunit GcvPA [Phycisphaerae bacterium]
MPFIPNTDAQRSRMLSHIGLSMEDLFADVPPDLLCPDLDLAAGLSEQEVRQHVASLAADESTLPVCFLGGGFYDHFIPAAVYAVLGRSEFYTAYTPYQPEASQGTLQAVYEYQSLICRLTEMEVSNASLYDGGTALVEALMMAVKVTGRSKVLIDDSVNPIYRAMIRSHTRNLDIGLEQTRCTDGLVDRAQIRDRLDDRTAAVLVQNPNFFGCLDDFSDLAEQAHAKGALLILSCYPIALGIAKTPGSMGADIATGEGQSLGLPMSFGGPYLGFMAARKDLVRKMPGRIVGQTTDRQGRRAFVLTLQAREQHIRRDKATSNICSNEALCALAAHAYLTLLGKQGLQETARACADKAGYAFTRLCAVPGVQPRFKAPCFFNEFVLDLPRDAADVLCRLFALGMAAGFPLGRDYPGMERSVLVCVTEKRTRQEIDRLAEALETVL